jgi:hypothetical protein
MAGNGREWPGMDSDFRGALVKEIVGGEQSVSVGRFSVSGGFSSPRCGSQNHIHSPVRTLM